MSLKIDNGTCKHTNDLQRASLPVDFVLAGASRTVCTAATAIGKPCK